MPGPGRPGGRLVPTFGCAEDANGHKQRAAAPDRAVSMMGMPGPAKPTQKRRVGSLGLGPRHRCRANG
jgi:hypothetical protein